MLPVSVWMLKMLLMQSQKEGKGGRYPAQMKSLSCNHLHKQEGNKIALVVSIAKRCRFEPSGRAIERVKRAGQPRQRVEMADSPRNVKKHPTEKFLCVAHDSMGHLPQIKVVSDGLIIVLFFAVCHFDFALLDGNRRALIRQATRLADVDRLIFTVDHVHINVRPALLLMAQSCLILDANDPVQSQQHIRFLKNEISPLC